MKNKTENRETVYSTLSKVPPIDGILLECIFKVTDLTVIDYARTLKSTRQTVYNRINAKEELISSWEAKVIVDLITEEDFNLAKKLRDSEIMNLRKGY